VKPEQAKASTRPEQAKASTRPEQAKASGKPAGGERSLQALAWERWSHFWFEPEETSTLAVMRILFGIVVLAWTLTLLPDLRAFFSPDGLVPQQPTFGLTGLWGPFSLSSSYPILLAACIVLALAAICLILGVGSRLASIVIWLGVLAFTVRNPYITNSGDGYLRVVAFYLILTPTGASLSLRRWLVERDRFWEFPRRSMWGLRLLQVQVSLVYLTAVFDKVSSGPLWNNGTALSYITRIADVNRFPSPTLATNSLPINLATYGTLAIELSLGVLIWNKRLRPWIVLLGVCLHLGIEYSIRVGFFSMVAIIALLSFISPAMTTKAILAVRDWFGRRAERRLSPSVRAE
jgi:hypothetical protein